MPPRADAMLRPEPSASYKEVRRGGRGGGEGCRLWSGGAGSLGAAALAVRFLPCSCPAFPSAHLRQSYRRVLLFASCGERQHRCVGACVAAVCSVRLRRREGSCGGAAAAGRAGLRPKELWFSSAPLDRFQLCLFTSEQKALEGDE